MDITIQKIFNDSQKETGVIITAALNTSLTLQSKKEIEQHLKEYATSIYEHTISFYSDESHDIVSLVCIWNQSELPRTSTYLIID